MEIDSWVADRLSEALLVPKEAITPVFIQEMKKREEAYKGDSHPNALWIAPNVLKLKRWQWAKEVLDSQK